MTLQPGQRVQTLGSMRIAIVLSIDDELDEIEIRWTSNGEKARFKPRWLRVVVEEAVGATP